MFEIMRYDRGMDVMPYAIGVRLRPPLTDPSGSEPTFVLLDSDVEVEEFMAAFNGPVAFDRPGAISWEPLLRWNDAEHAYGGYGPCLLRLSRRRDAKLALPATLRCPTRMFAAGKARSENTVRGRYNFRQFPPEEKYPYVRELSEARAKAGGTDVFINGKLPVSLVDLLNPRKPGSDQ